MEAASSKWEAGVGDGAPGALVGDLFREHARTVYGLCLVLLRNAHEAEDATQAAFVSAYESVSRGTTPEQPNAWLLTIARNECLDRLRRRTARPETQLLEEDVQAVGVEEIAARNASITELRVALSELPENQREAIVLHELGGLGYTQVAETLGVSVSAVESLLFRARQRLRERTDALRVLGGLLILPVGLREGLAQAIPGFPATHAAKAAVGTQAGASGAVGGGGGSAAGGAAGGSVTMSGGTLGTISVKLASLPLVAKVAATVAVVAGTASTVVHEVASRPTPRTPAAIEVAAGFPDDRSLAGAAEQLTSSSSTNEVDPGIAPVPEGQSGLVTDGAQGAGPSAGDGPPASVGERPGSPTLDDGSARPSSDEPPEDVAAPTNDPSTPQTESVSAGSGTEGSASSGAGGTPPGDLPPSPGSSESDGTGSSGGPPDDDPPNDDPPNDDPPNSGPPNSGPPNNDPPNEDPADNDPPDSGPPNDDPPNDNPPDNDPPDSGPPNDNPPDNDPPDSGPPDSDPPHNDPPAGGGGSAGGGGGSDDGDSGKKIAICHHPPGNPEVGVTISVSVIAAIIHLLHGDELGPC